MRKFKKTFRAIYLFLFLSSCISMGSGPLTNSISVSSGQTKVKHKLPNGFCLDKSANSSNSLQRTLVITNCIAVNNVENPYYSRRPVDTIVKITFTKSEIPRKISKKEYLSEIAENLELKKFLIGPSNKKLIYGEKNIKDKYFYVNFQILSSSKRPEHVRKYFFFVDNKVAVMTILTFKKTRMNTYSSFETFIKKLS